jgi:predicted transcriptional regulator
MSVTIELDDDLAERLATHLEDDQTYEELIEELLTIYEQDRFIQEGYSED